eukprot:1169589-Rhodomonas_salina.1
MGREETEGGVKRARRRDRTEEEREQEVRREGHKGVGSGGRGAHEEAFVKLKSALPSATSVPDTA